MISLGIDLGGTQIKYGLVEDGKILDCGICDTRLEEGYQAVVHRMADCAKSFLRGAEAEFVGIASPGLVDTYQGVVRYSNNLAGIMCRLPRIFLTVWNFQHVSPTTPSAQHWAKHYTVPEKGFRGWRCLRLEQASAADLYEMDNWKQMAMVLWPIYLVIVLLRMMESFATADKGVV